MSIIEMAGRISQIQSQLGLTGQSAGTTSSTGAGGQDFATVLAAAKARSTSAGLTAGESAGGRTGSDVVADARRYLGVPYVWGSTDPAKGLDCSGLVQRVYADLGVHLPRVSGDQAKSGTAVASMAQARPGDILAFGHPVHHVAIYIGNGQMIAAPEAGDHVKIQKVYETPSAIRRVFSAQPATNTSPALGAVPYAGLFAAAGAKYHVAPALLAAVAKVESGFDRSATSHAGARGLMQLMPGTARELGVDPTDPAQAIDGAARLLAGNLRKFGSVPLALAAYNAGAGAVQRYGGIPPYAETQSYVRKVEAVLAGYQS
ncbi:MAG: lytic transglycosylase [Pseudonocardiales bacterium]|nr:MAG: lytic transglycosylase [Pseudonocardiales bacterium]